MLGFPQEVSAKLGLRTGVGGVLGLSLFVPMAPANGVESRSAMPTLVWRVETAAHLGLPTARLLRTTIRGWSGGTTASAAGSTMTSHVTVSGPSRKAPLQMKDGKRWRPVRSYRSTRVRSRSGERYGGQGKKRGDAACCPPPGSVQEGVVSPVRTVCPLIG